MAPDALNKITVAMTQPLFRPEVVTERQSQWLGTVLLAPAISHRLFTAFALVAIAAIVALLYFGEFTRKARISGWLVAEGGIARVFAPRPGVVAHLHVKEGMRVRQGDPLLALSAELQSTTLGATQAEISRRLASQRASLLTQRQETGRLATQQQRAMGERIAALQTELTQIDGEIELQRSRLRLAREAEGLQSDLRAQNFISAQAFQQAQSARIEQEARLRALERSRTTVLREKLTLESERRDLPLKSAAESSTIDRSIADVERQLAEAEAQREIIIPAPQDGTVTGIHVELGSSAAVNVPLLSIVPNNARLQAHLYSPSRAVGFVRPGQRVLLRYHAYPYQKFGHYAGVVASVSRSAVSPSDLPPQLSGIVGQPGNNEPVYRITVSLERQAVTAYGQPVALQPGMQLEADVAIETRRLAEWVLDPLYTLTGRLRG